LEDSWRGEEIQKRGKYVEWKRKGTWEALVCSNHYGIPEWGTGPQRGKANKSKRGRSEIERQSPPCGRGGHCPPHRKGGRTLLKITQGTRVRVWIIGRARNRFGHRRNMNGVGCRSFYGNRTRGWSKLKKGPPVSKGKNEKPRRAESAEE